MGGSRFVAGQYACLFCGNHLVERARNRSSNAGPLSNHPELGTSHGIHGVTFSQGSKLATARYKEISICLPHTVDRAHMGHSTFPRGDSELADPLILSLRSCNGFASLGFRRKGLKGNIVPVVSACCCYMNAPSGDIVAGRYTFRGTYI